MRELPPRARRIHVDSQNGYGATGTTSACAENTEARNAELLDYWNYLRVRGEYDRAARDNRGIAELPPRARRIRHQHITEIRESGTTSACAENTHP